MNNEYQNLFEPINILECEIKNRFAMAPMGTLGMADFAGGWNQRGIDYFVERARGGVGLITTGVSLVDTAIEKINMPSSPSSTYNPTHFVRTSREMTERIHAYSAKIFFMMSAGFGRVAPPHLGQFPPVSASPIQQFSDN